MTNNKIQILDTQRSPYISNNCKRAKILCIPLKMNSNSVFKFSGLGLVTKILE